jgi:eukaryotic-like serine/threonine-protein kinase
MPSNEQRKQEDFLREQAVFLAAVEVGPEDRKAILDAECGGDAGLRQRVEALLAAHDAEGSLPPVAPPLDETQALEAAAGAMIAGKYKLLEAIGCGGMGVVWMAEQRTPVRRLVALKLIKAGMDSRIVIARFEAERQALAMMDHPNIARVFDGGITEQGRPYFAMELVRGLPITQYCDQRRMTVRDRLLLFTQVCHAVQHAHQKGIIHRDIKPTNVLVTEHDGLPVPKVIDFGLAKAIGGTGVLTEHTVYTGFGQIAGTPLYTAPEQVAINSIDVDTRADVYALGVLLYELLTGSTPLDRERLKQAAWDEVCRVIREEEPLRPSTRISTSALLPSLAASRQTDAAKLSGLIKGDLDWIILKTLEKERRLRYDTATALVADIERHLNDEPVVAAPPSVGYLARKFLRKHKKAVLTAAAAVALLAIGLASTTWQWCRADANAKAARQNGQVAEVQRKTAESRRIEADNQRRVAEEQRKAAEEQRKVAEEQRKETASQLQRAERFLYVSHIQLAQRDWEAADVAGAWQHLNACREDLRGWEYDYLHRQFTKGHKSLDGHTREINSVAFSPDGRRIASGSGDGTIKVWDAATSQEIITIKGHTGDGFEGEPVDVNSVAFSPDGRHIASGYDDKTIRVWDAATGQEILTIKAHTWVNSVTFSPDGRRIASESWDNTIEVWNAATGQETLTIKGSPTRAHGVAFSPDGRRIASGCYDSTVKIWDAATGQEFLSLRGHTSGVYNVAFSPDGRHIASSSWDKTVKVWDAATGQELLTLKGHSEVVGSVAFSPDGRRIASASDDKTAKLWDAATGEQILTFKRHIAKVLCVAFSPDGRHIASGSVDNTVKVWDLAASHETLTLKGHQFVVLSVAFSPDGRRIASGAVDNTIKVWDAATGLDTLTLVGHSGIVCSVAFSPDGRRIASGSWDKTVKVWDAATGEELLTLNGHSEVADAPGQGLPFFSVAFSPDGRRIAGGSADNTVKVWDVTTGQETLTLRGHTGFVHSVVFGPDGRHIASGSWDKTIKVWDAATGQETRTLKGHSDYVQCVAFSLDGRHIASGSWDKTIKIWDAATGRETRTLKGHTDIVQSVAFSPDGRRIASGAEDNTIKIWDAATGLETLTLKDGLVYSVVFCPDGRRIASGGSGDDKTIQKWEDRIGYFHQREHLSTVPLNETFDPDNNESSDSTIKIWDATTGTDEKAETSRPARHQSSLTKVKRVSQRRLPGSKKLVDAFERWSWSPDGKQIAYAGGYPSLKTNLWILDMQTNRSREFLKDAHDPAWSPGDGHWIAFERRPNEDANAAQIWLVPSVGGEPKKLCAGTFPIWSADGKALYFYSHEKQKLLTIKPDEPSAKPTEFADVNWPYPAISPDGNRMAFFGDGNLTVIDRKTDKIVLTLPLAGWQGLIASWSPDGKKVAYGGYGITNSDGLWIYDFETKQQLKVADGPWTSPIWSPDGSKFTFQFRTANEVSIWMVDAKILGTLKTKSEPTSSRPPSKPTSSTPPKTVPATKPNAP